MGKMVPPDQKAKPVARPPDSNARPQPRTRADFKRRQREVLVGRGPVARREVNRAEAISQRQTRWRGLIVGREEPDGTLTVVGFSKTRRVTSREKLVEAGYTLRPLSPRTANAYRVFYLMLYPYVRSGLPLPSELDDETLAGYALAVSVKLQQEFERLRRSAKPYIRRQFNRHFKTLDIGAPHALGDPLGFLIHVSTFSHFCDLATVPPVLHRAFGLLMDFARGITIQLVHHAIALGDDRAPIGYNGERWWVYELRPSSPGKGTCIVCPVDRLTEIDLSVLSFRRRLGDDLKDFKVFCERVLNNMHACLDQIASNLYCLLSSRSNEELYL